MCNEEETIIHLVYECIYAMSSWSKVNNFYYLEGVVLGTNLSDEMNIILSFLVFFICKEWLYLVI